MWSSEMRVVCGTPVDVLGEGEWDDLGDLVDVEQFERAAAQLASSGERASTAAFDLWATAAAYRIRWNDTREARADLEHALRF
jgi:hypothetical protein